MRHGAFLFASASIFAFFWALPLEALEVSVLSRAELTMEARGAGTTLTVHGSLRDDSGAGVPAQRVYFVAYSGRDRVVEVNLTTGYHGEFTFFEELAPGNYQVELFFPGGSYLSEAHQREEITLERAPPRLRVEGPSWVLGTREPVSVQIQATSGGRGLPGFITAIQGDRPISTIPLDSRGRAEFDVRPYLRNGVNTLRFRLEGSSYREPVLRTLEIRNTPELRTRVEVEPLYLRFERGFEVEVFLSDEFGALEEGLIRLYLTQEEGEESREIRKEERSDYRGRGRFFVSFDELEGERWQIRVEVRPDVGKAQIWEGESMQEEVPVINLVVRWLAILGLVCALLWLFRRVMLALFEKVIVSWKSLREESPEEQKAQFERELFTPLERASVKALQPGGETIGVLRLQIWDTFRNRPLAGARVLLDETTELECDEKGSVVIPRGTTEIRAQAHGFLPVEASIKDHTTGMVRLEITAVPLKIRHLYRHLIRSLERDDPWGRLTPRQIKQVLAPLTLQVQHESLRSSPDWERVLQDWESLSESERPAALLAAVTALVEETNFSERTFDLETFEASKLVIQELLTLLSWQRGGEDGQF